MKLLDFDLHTISQYSNRLKQFDIQHWRKQKINNGYEQMGNYNIEVLDLSYNLGHLL